MDAMESQMAQETAGPAVIRDRVQIRSVADISAAIAYGMAHGGLLLSESHLCPEFFNLRSGLAGEMMQKFVNYRLRLAIVVASPEAHGERFCELVREHRSHPAVRFFVSEAEASAWLGAAC
jgi:hypothetical protein